MIRRVVAIPSVCDPQSDDSLDTLIKLAIPYTKHTERDVRYLIDKVDQIVEAGTWPRRLDREPKTWERFCLQVLGCDSRYFDKLREALNILDAQRNKKGGATNDSH